MTTLVTVLLFAAVTALFVVLHLRKGRSEAGRAGDAGPCPRCGASFPARERICPACGAPRQAYELVTATLAPREPPPGDAGGRRHAIVRKDLCVGCSGCVSVCPVPGAVTMRNRLAVVDAALCQAHARCVEACPTGAIFVGVGGASEIVVVPDLDANFQSSVPGLYVVGELGGRGLIKNAINEGRLAVEHAATLVEGREGAILDLVVVGSGPAGLSAGLEAHRRGLRYAVLEQGSLADTIRRYPRHKLLLAEPVQVPLYGELWVADTTKESLLGVWKRIVERTGLAVLEAHRVSDVSRRDDAFDVATPRGVFRARRVVLAMGRRGTPRRLEVEGEELAKVVYDVAEMEVFAGRKVLVVGGGDSAIETAIGLVRQRGTEVTLCHRGDAFPRVKERNLRLLGEASRRPNLRIVTKTRVLAIGPQSVRIEVGGLPEEVPNDDVVVRVGGEPATPMLERAGIRMVRKAVPVVSADGSRG